MRRLAALAAIVLGVAAPAAADVPLTRPITGADGARWLEPQAPLRVFGGTSYIGSKRVKQALVDTGAGLVLIDAGLPEGFATLDAQVASLGYRLADVKLVLVSEPHYDHAGAIAAVVRVSGAQVIASAATARALRHGISGDEDPQRASLIAYPPVARVRAVHDGAVVRLGRVAITAHAMPGQTPGSMGWSWRSCDHDGCADVLFAASLNPLTAGTYRYFDHPDLVAGLRRTLDWLGRRRCDILLSNHAEHSGADQRIAARLAEVRPDPMRDAGACRAMSGKYRKALDAELERERAAP